MAARKDNKGRNLRTGEYYNAKTHVYQFRKMINGERVTITDTDLTELRKRENELLVALDKGKIMKNRNKNMTFDEYFEFWFTTYAPNGRKPSTLSKYKHYYELYAKKAIGNKKIGKITKVDVQILLNDMTGRGLKRLTLNTLRACLNGVFECALDDDIIFKNPARNIELPPRDSKSKEALSEDQLDIFMDFVKNSPDFEEYYAMFVVLFNTGIRVGELAALTWDNIDFANDVIHVKKTLITLDKDVYNVQYAIGTPKSNTSNRSIAMNAVTKNALLQHRFRLPFNREYSIPMIDDLGRVTGQCTDFVFRTKNNTVLTEGAVRLRIHAIVDKYNKGVSGNDQKLEYFSPHTTRHTFTSKAYEAGADMKIVSELLGHSSTSITLDIYTHLTEKKQLEKQETVKTIQIS